MWIYQNQPIEEIPQGIVGFVYIITNLITGKKYIGKKLFLHSKTTYKTIKLKNGSKKKKRIRSKVESNWVTYYGSSINLTADIELLGKENFKREILHFCKSKASTTYLELREQIDQRVLESDDYYNNQVQARVHGSHIKNKI